MDDHTDAGWRVKCPRGHTRLRRQRDGRYYCRSCDRHYDRSDLRG
ncbi:hypothetical protein [Halobacterium yunchengense]